MNNGEILAEQFGKLGLAVKFIKEKIFYSLTIYYYDLENVARYSQKSIEYLLEKMSVFNHKKLTFYPTSEAHFAVSLETDTKGTLWLGNIGLGAIGQELGKGDFKFNFNSVKHILVAGTTGSGKSVFLNTFIYSTIHQFNGNCGVYIVDLKRIGFQYWARHGCLVYTEPKQIEDLLYAVVDEMERRYKLLSQNKSANLKPLFVIIDELADLMLNKSIDCEENIIRLAQKARGANIHLVLATQRPTVNVVNGLIKANCDTRVCLKVASARDSVVILDHKGGEKLLGRGDSLIKLPTDFEEKRVQIAYGDFE